jgi:hypothetical protein
MPIFIVRLTTAAGTVSFEQLVKLVNLPSKWVCKAVHTVLPKSLARLNANDDTPSSAPENQADQQTSVLPANDVNTSAASGDTKPIRPFAGAPAYMFEPPLPPHLVPSVNLSNGPRPPLFPR